jgi:phosphoribosylamine--glycine ligase
MVLEFNARFGDPESQPLVMRMKGDLLPVLLAVADGKLADASLDWRREAAVCVVMASGGYPGKYQKGHPIEGLNAFKGRSDVVVFHAGTCRAEGRVVTNGGRVLGVTALGKDVAAAQRTAYEAVHCIRFQDAHYRTDIASKALKR